MPRCVISSFFFLLLMMKFLYWNCRGAKSSCLRRIFKDIVKLRQPDLVALVELNISRNEA